MKANRPFIMSLALDLAVLGLFGALCGCESDSAARRIEVRPDAATLRYGESVTLTAYNGYIYSWSLENETYGRLSSRSGMMVTYTSLTDPTAPVVQVIKVTSSFSDNSDDSSSSNPVAHTAEAYITHIPMTSIVSVASSTF